VLSLAAGGAPAKEPVGPDDLVKVHLHVDGGDEDALITNAIKASREWAEAEMGRACIQQTLELRLPVFCGPYIEIPMPPLIQVVSVTYLDYAGVRQTWDPTLWSFSAPAGERCGRGRLFPLPFGIWPVAMEFHDSVIITFKAGYGLEPANVPASIRSAILLQVGDLYRNREASIVGTIVAANPAALALLGPFRNKRFGVAA
jgi:uncharacterized phiE125 gp8 family phage protein